MTLLCLSALLAVSRWPNILAYNLFVLNRTLRQDSAGSCIEQLNQFAALGRDFARRSLRRRVSDSDGAVVGRRHDAGIVASRIVVVLDDPLNTLLAQRCIWWRVGVGKSVRHALPSAEVVQNSGATGRSVGVDGHSDIVSLTDFEGFEHQCAQGNPFKPTECCAIASESDARLQWAASGTFGGTIDSDPNRRPKAFSALWNCECTCHRSEATAALLNTGPYAVQSLWGTCAGRPFGDGSRQGSHRNVKDG